MGDAADFALEQVEFEEERRSKYLRGEISFDEAWDAGLLNDDGSIGAQPTLKTCRCCGQPNLHWEETKKGWRLFNDDEIHHCPVAPLKD